MCMRTCEGPQCQMNLAHQHSGLGLGEDSLPGGKRVCSGCCVEIGSEGMVWCLACYTDDTELEPFSMKHTKEELEVESANRIADWLNRTGPEVDTNSDSGFSTHCTDFTN